MKSYNIVTPSIYGILSDDHLFFEGVSRPSQFYSVRDYHLNSGENILIMEKYFNDLYNLFLRKLSTYVSVQTSTKEDSVKIEALLQEIIKVKDLIEKASSPDIIGK